MIKKTKILWLLSAMGMLQSLFSPVCFASSIQKEPPLRMTVDQNGKMNISRRKIGNTPMGEKDTWTIFVYICGADLESEWGLATSNILAMQESENAENTRFILETGGTCEWKNNTMSPGELGRYEISNGTCQELERIPESNMGEPQTLYDFLSWGIENYPAEKMGLVFWDHGGGSITGVCFDETTSIRDSLTLNEINLVLDAVSDEMTDRFEFIGFDACLMATLENANLLATYARYMYASEETQPGCGWDYAAIGKAISEYPQMDGAELGIILTDSYIEACKAWNAVNKCTFSVIELGKIDDVVIAFHDYVKELYESTDTNDSFTSLTRLIRAVDNYGGNNRSEGYTNMIDVTGFANVGQGILESADALADAVDRAVYYYHNGKYHYDAAGLSMYYPLKFIDNQDLIVLEKIAPSPYYLAYVDRMAYAMTHEGRLENYNGTQKMIDSWSNYWAEYACSDAEAYLDQTGLRDYFNSYVVAPEGMSDLISFDEAPAVSEDGNAYTFTLSPEGLNNTASAYGALYWISEDQSDYLELGWTGDVNADWETGYVYDNFVGKWVSLPDGQNLATYTVQEDEKYTIYSCPILLNGYETNLRIIRDYENNFLYMEGCWDGIGSSGMASRNWITLQPGDVIRPVYKARTFETDEEKTYYGEEYTYDGTDDLMYSRTFDGLFFYSFVVEDVFGNYMETKPVSVYVDTGGDVTFGDII